MATDGYTKGLHEIGDGVFAYLQPDGGWGWSNAGLVVDGDASLLVDTLFDLRLTGEMLDAMRRATPAAASLDVVVNTHANGDHCWGNQLVREAEIVGSRRCAEEMAELPPALLAALVAAPPDGPAGDLVRTMFGAFDFDGIEVVPPTTVFDGELTLRVGGTEVHLIEVGPAHTQGDVIVHLPAAGVVFTGDILFNGGHPIVWAGPVANWTAACDRIVALAPDTVVPGHGPVCGVAEVGAQRDYFAFVEREVAPRAAAGLDPLAAARDIDLGPYRSLGEAERFVANVAAVYRDLGYRAPGDAVTILGQMADFGSPAAS
ncbi:MAG TPA: MBL fold metallo-hydrolase [Acidimicrobiales bacterium]|nr:MBL fold metallo-hydrolase [Acidimicrobiales bacterium]